MNADVAALDGTVDPRVSYFDRHAPRWEQDGPSPTETLRRLAELQPQLDLRPRQRILEVGCGTGVVTQWLADRVPGAEITALDFSPHMLAAAKAKAIRAEFVQMDICLETPARSAFDAALCLGVFPHLRDKAAALGHLVAALRKGGRLLVLHFRGSKQLNALHRSLGEPVCHDLLPQGEEWTPMLRQAGLRLESLVDRPDLFLLKGVCDREAPQ